eukprot:5030343-Alexandrium_andersonii.AAC.1
MASHSACCGVRLPGLDALRLEAEAAQEQGHHGEVVRGGVDGRANAEFGEAADGHQGGKPEGCNVADGCE